MLSSRPCQFDKACLSLTEGLLFVPLHFFLTFWDIECVLAAGERANASRPILCFNICGRIKCANASKSSQT